MRWTAGAGRKLSRTATAAAIERAEAAGANPSSIEVVDVEEVPLTYVPSNATRVRVKAVGNIAADRLR